MLGTVAGFCHPQSGLWSGRILEANDAYMDKNCMPCNVAIIGPEEHACESCNDKDTSMNLQKAFLANL